MQVVRYQPAQAGAWNTFVGESVNGTFLFNRNYMDYHSGRFADHSLIVMDNDRWVAVIPASSNGNEWCSHLGLSYGGFVFGGKLSQTKLQHCLALCLDALVLDGMQYAKIKVIPDIYATIRQQSLHYALFHQGFELYRRDASTSIFLNERQKLSKGRKASIKKAARLGVRVEKSLDFKPFMALENETLQKKYGVSAVHTATEMAMLAENFPKNIKLYNATFNGQLVAGGIVYQSTNVMHLQYMATNELGAETGAGDLVVEAMLLDCEKGGVNIFDFGISTENDGKFLNEGLNKYKESFGGVTTVADFYLRDLRG